MLPKFILKNRNLFYHKILCANVLGAGTNRRLLGVLFVLVGCFVFYKCRFFLLAEVSVFVNGYTKMGCVINLDDVVLFDPCVIQLDNGDLRMYVSNRSKGCISYLESVDGEKWTELKDAFLPQKELEWQTVVNRATVLKVQGGYRMYYTGQTEKNSYIGVAFSVDGKSFKNLSFTPILEPSSKEENTSVMNPCVMYDKRKGKYVMYYAAGEQYEPNVICYAESKDGNSWKKTKEPIIKKRDGIFCDSDRVGGCEVYVDDSGTYNMYYIGYSDIDTARVCYATSDDGLMWQRKRLNVVVSPDIFGFDRHACYKPTVFCDGKGSKYLWYNGRNRGVEKIGLVKKER